MAVVEMSGPASPGERVRAYHDGTKHAFHRFARSLGHLDWASQPRPFRSFAGARVVPLDPRPGTASLPQLPFIGRLLRHALGLSAWKVFRESRWSLRVNPSSGNLHPTEAYVVSAGSVWHYAPDLHALEERCRFDPHAWAMLLDATGQGHLAGAAGNAEGNAEGNVEGNAGGDDQERCLVVLTSIHWRESWKYGERAFRYCQHDTGHALAALRLAAAMCGARAHTWDDWTHAQLAAVTGCDRDEDFREAEREEPACALFVSRAEGGDDPGAGMADVAAGAGTPREAHAFVEAFVAAVRRGTWSGQASQLSEDHVQWTFIDEVAEASRRLVASADAGWRHAGAPGSAREPGGAIADAGAGFGATEALVLTRRSAVAFDGQTSMSRDAFFTLLAGVMPGASAPWDLFWWRPAIHLLLFVHRVDGLSPGLYLMPRTAEGEALLRQACTREFSWTAVDAPLPLFTLATGDCRRLAQRLSCDQDIAADGCFSIGMLADFDRTLREHGPSFYRRLFWEAGAVGQVLYLAAEAAGLRGTGIGCYYDDPVHDVLGLTDHAVQSLYHFTIGGPVDDRRLTTEPGYAWESRALPSD